MNQRYVLGHVIVFVATLVSSVYADELPGFKPAPERPPVEASVIVEDQQVLDECDPDHICIEGNLYNQGSKTAYRMKLKVEVGGSKYVKPRTSFFTPLENTTLEAGSRMGFSATLKRKIPYKDKTGEDKIIEAGRYNVKLVPVWSASDKKLSLTGPAKKR